MLKEGKTQKRQKEEVKRWKRKNERKIQGKRTKDRKSDRKRRLQSLSILSQMPVHDRVGFFQTAEHGTTVYTSY
jgi:hypothetical protein